MPKFPIGPFHRLRQIEIVYRLTPGLNSPFVQTFFDGSLSAKAQKILKSPPPINPATREPYSAQALYNLHVKQIVNALAEHKKDGGGISEYKGRKTWKAVFEVKDRQPRHVG